MMIISVYANCCKQSSLWINLYCLFWILVFYYKKKVYERTKLQLSNEHLSFTWSFGIKQNSGNIFLVFKAHNFASQYRNYVFLNVHPSISWNPIILNPYSHQQLHYKQESHYNRKYLSTAVIKNTFLPFRNNKFSCLFKGY